uniref:NADH dehydrogenase subunit 2 n=1 Tax=Allodiplogaster sp. MY-2022 TaxID=2938886 RepID=UPI00208E6E2E|nr:NADH dehydrogenase subunit 2 [Allodiplogaster sp. MY-2022]URY63356.1 NADH dehydrogenase subunit 2 [Allodiplogaster sp. MY-2022]
MYLLSVLFLSFICFISFNLVVWWSVFLVMTFVFISINKSLSSYIVLVNYFIIQEVVGLLFLFFNFYIAQLIFLFIKVGVAPFHFWLFGVLWGVYDYSFFWFLTFQKLPFIMVFFSLGGYFYFIFINFWVCFFCYFQIFLLKSFKFLIILSSTESFNWFLMVNSLIFSVSFYLFFYYLIIISFLLFKGLNFFFNFNTWESLLVFLNMPFMLTFFVKIFSLMGIVGMNLFIFVLLFLMFLSSLSFGYWLVILSTKFNFFSDFKNQVFSIIVFVLSFFCLI